jgi:prepilin-type N-terminal cleavage/methylation domain-containing protein
MTNVEKVATAGGRHSRYVIDSSFVIRLPRRSRAKAGHSSFTARSAFTLIELVVVVGIILILAGLVLSTAGYARKKGARARAETEIAAMSAACESYKADNGIYPNNGDTNNLNARTSGNASSPSYNLTSLALYNSLFGATNGSRTPDAGARSYFVFKPNMLSPADQTQRVLYIRDPFGYSYGYSTIQAATGDTTKGYNPTFDLWSTAGLTTDPPPSGTDTITPQWIKNW